MGEPSIEVEGDNARSELEQPKPTLNGTPSTKNHPLNRDAEGMESGPESLAQDKPKLESRNSVCETLSQSGGSSSRGWREARERSNSTSTSEAAGITARSRSRSSESEQGMKPKLVLNGRGR